jgi:Plasmid encoded RepA protein
LRRPPRNSTSHIRRNGKFFLQIIGHPQFGLPYGQDRLIAIWIATLALRQRSRVVRFACAAEMLDFFHLFKDGKRYRRMMEGFQRIFAATIFFGTNDDPNGKLVLDWARFHFFDRMRLWFHKGEGELVGSDSDGNSIVLSEAFYEEIDQHPIPVEQEVVAALANAPGVLDLYLWLAWRTWSLKGRSVRIPLFTQGGLVDQLGSIEYSEKRFFRRKLAYWLKEVRTFWPECPARISQDGLALIIRSAKNTFAISNTQTPRSV